MQNNPRLSIPSLVLTAMILAAAVVGFSTLRPRSSPALPEPSAPEADTANATLNIQYAENIAFESMNGFTRVTVHEAWPGAQPIRYVVVEPGASPPAQTGRYDAVVPAEPRRVISLVTPTIAHMHELDVLDRLVGVETPDYIYNATVLEQLASGDVRRVGGGPELDLELVVALRPDLVFVSALGPDEAALKRLSAAGIPVLLLADWREQSPLGRAEWIKLFGVVFNRSEQAELIFAEIAERYEQLRSLTSMLPDADRPTVMANGPWQGSWPTPAGESYMARLFGDAGGRYLWNDIPGAGSYFLDLESVLARAANAEYWINLNYDWLSRADVVRADSRLTRFRAFQEGHMYHHNARVRDSGANDFWESGAGRPDLVLADLVGIFHPELMPGHSPVYYQRLAK